MTSFKNCTPNFFLKFDQNLFPLLGKHELKLLCFLIIKKLSAIGRVKELLREVDLMSIVTDKLEMTLAVMQRNRHLDTTKRTGVLKVKIPFHLKDIKN